MAARVMRATFLGDALILELREKRRAEAAG
jgi:hypothetical protein